MGKEIILQSIITCPNCGHQKEEAMPTDACQFFYECQDGQTILTPQQGDCWVFCSYGSQSCSPMQEGKSGGCCI